MGKLFMSSQFSISATLGSGAGELSEEEEVVVG